MKTIRRGCIVTDAKGRIGIVGYSSYNVELSCVTWERRLTHDICKNEQLTLLLTKKQAAAAYKLGERNV